VYKPSVGNYHSAKRGIDSARAVGVIEDSYRMLVRLAANLGLPTMPPKYKPVGMQGEWGGWSEWLNDVNVWQIEAEARLAAAEARVRVDSEDLLGVPPSRPVDRKKDNAEKLKKSHPRNLKELKDIKRKVCKGKQQGITQEQSVREYVEKHYPNLRVEEQVLRKCNSLIRSMNRYKHLLKSSR
jgi:hypothetical protein